MVYNNMKDETVEAHLVEQLTALNTKLEKQMSFQRIFGTGIIYGVGFFLGSAILAVIALGIFGPMIGSIPWVQETFHRGTVILHEGN